MMQIKDMITTCILGSKGSGKSVLLAMMMNEYKGRVVLFDMLGVFNPTAKNRTAVIPNSYYFLYPDLYLKNFDKLPENARAVIDFSGFIVDELVRQVDAVCNFLMAKKEPVAVLSDEVADFIAQSGPISYGFWKMVKNGRNFGIRPVVFASQRPQDINKKVFDLCDEFLISRQKAPRTIDYITDIMNKAGDKGTRDMLLKIKPREFLQFDGESYTIYKVPEYDFAHKQ